jgi:hypothetical protein
MLTGPIYAAPPKKPSEHEPVTYHYICIACMMHLPHFVHTIENKTF